MKVAYCGYDFFHTCLRYLINQDHEILHAFTFECDNQFNYNQYINGICYEHDIPIKEEPITPNDLENLQSMGCELLISAGYLHKIPELKNSNIKGINIHPTKLPVGRGVWPLPWIILKDFKEGCVTIHKVTQKLDAGDILTQQCFSLDDKENLESLSCKLQMVAKNLLRQTMEDFEAHWMQARAQDESKMSYWPMTGVKDRTLDWRKSVSELDRTARAFGKAATYAFFNNKWWFVFDINAWKWRHQAKIGSVVHKTNTEMVIAASDGYVCLKLFTPFSDEQVEKIII